MTVYTDDDGDGYGEPTSAQEVCDPRDAADNGDDCDDTDADSYPGATETPYDGVDQDCDGEDLCDVDGDGADADAGSCGGDDCDDADGTSYPGATEVFYDGVDQACGGGDDYDQDGDGFADETYGGEDCDDSRADVYPGAEELKDDVDNDCDGRPEGCGCASGPTPAAGGLTLALLALAGVRRRSRPGRALPGSRASR